MRFVGLQLASKNHVPVMMQTRAGYPYLPDHDIAHNLT